MIARLSGQLIYQRPPTVMVDVHGVAYEMQCPMSTIYKLPQVGDPVTVLTHCVIRDDAHLLFAFLSEHECSLFREIIKVSGIGPKIALAILSGIEVSLFRDCILNKDIEALVRIPGIGEKTAERLAIEMQGVFKKSTFWQQLPGAEPASFGQNEDDAIQGLVALGYKKNEARRWVTQVGAGDMEASEIIRKALQLSFNPK